MSAFASETAIASMTNLVPSHYLKFVELEIGKVLGWGIGQTAVQNLKVSSTAFQLPTLGEG